LIDDGASDYLYPNQKITTIAQELASWEQFMLIWRMGLGSSAAADHQI
jgi:hypothetical protein